MACGHVQKMRTKASAKKLNAYCGDNGLRGKELLIAVSDSDFHQDFGGVTAERYSFSVR